MAERQRRCSVPILPAVSAALAPPDPPPGAATRSRARLERAMAAADIPPEGRARPRPFPLVGPRVRARPARVPRPRLVAAAGLAAAVAVGAAFVVPRFTGGPGPAVPTGRATLLAAATTAAAQPVRTGRYWRVRTVTTSGDVIRETWTSRDGRMWATTGPSGPVRRLHGEHQVVFGARLGLTEIGRLPADPARLRSALLRAVHPPPRSPAQRRITLINELESLLTDAPAPPRVRGAAFRALAQVPRVTDRGPAGADPRVRRLMIDYGVGANRIVVDPGRARMRSEAWTGFGDGPNPVDPYVRTGSWTNHLPDHGG